MESIDLSEYLANNSLLVKLAIFGLLVFLVGLVALFRKEEYINRFAGRILDLGFSFTSGLLMGLILFFDNDQTPSNFTVFGGVDITLLIVIISVSWNSINLVGSFLVFYFKPKKGPKFILGKDGKMTKE